MSLGQHNLGAIICMVAGQRIQGTGDEGISIAPVTAEDIETAVSGDGEHVVATVTNDARLMVTISVMQTSVAYKRLSALRAAQDASVAAASGTAFDRRFYFSNPLTGDKCVSNQTIMVNKPAMQGKKAAQMVEFKLVLPAPTVTRGANL